MIDDEEVLEAVEEVSPLIALPAEDVERLSPRKQRFLITYIQTGSLQKARKVEGVSLQRWKAWIDDPDFARVYNIVKSPVLFTYALVQAIGMRAAQEHFKLLSHERVQVRQWAIERAYALAANMSDQQRRRDRGEEIQALTQADVKQLVEGVAAKMDESERRRIERTPFQIIEGEVVGSNSRRSNSELPSSEE